MSNGLWQVSVASYAQDMLFPIFDNSMEADLRNFFTDYVRARGALPSVRSGIQPYGILPATAYSRINWQNDPRAGLYSKLHVLSQNLSLQWSAQVQDLISASIDNPGQSLSDVLSQSAVSLDYMQRIGVGSGYVWNSLAYDYDQTMASSQFDQWRDIQQARMGEMEDMLQVPFSPRPRIAQMNFLEGAFPMQVPLVADESLGEDAPLPGIGGGQNYLQVLSRAPFRELRDGNYSVLGGGGLHGPEPMLYQYARQSLLLEYFEAACNLLGIPPADRVAPELVNVETEEQPQNRGGGGVAGEDFSLFAGRSRWEVFEQPFEGFRNVGEFLDSGAARSRPEVANLFKAKDGLQAISGQPIGSLKLLTSEVIDATAYRLDTWRLALVNQRLNALRGIVDGSLGRNKGIYLGAYGWLENIRKGGTKEVVNPPTNHFIPTPDFSGATIFKDSASHGFIHAPSINQAVTGAVLRSGYMNRADANESSPLSINISSERTRAALLLLEGVRNGQELGVLLGYEFERRLHENYPVGFGLDASLKFLREEYAINNTIIPYGGGTPDEVKARNVVNGEAVINASKQIEANGQSKLANFLTDTDKFPHPDGVTAIFKEADWIGNLMDATGDLTIAEGAFHIVQGNPVKASGIMDAMSKGTNTIPEMDVIHSQKTGLYVNQRFTFHVEADTTPAPGWPTTLTPKATAEPYLNRWAGKLLGSPANIKCKVTAYAGTPDATELEVSLEELGLSALDFVLSVNDTLEDDDSEIALRIRKMVRTTYGYNRSVPLSIAFNTSVDASEGLLSFAQIHPLALATRDFVTVSRPLNTLDYISPTEALDENHDFDLAEFHTRVNGALALFSGVRTTLQTAFNNFGAPLPTAAAFTALHNALYGGSFYGLANTLYEFKDETEEDAANLHVYATAVLSTIGKKEEEAVALSFGPSGSVAPQDQLAYIEKGREILKLIYGKSFNALPLFGIRSTERDSLNTLVSTSPGPLLDDHSGAGAPFGDNPYLVDEWISAIARVRKNAERFEWLSILSSTVDVDTFSGATNNSYKAVALQLPYDDDSISSTDRWLGAAVENAEALKFGRVSYGTSLPANHSFSGYQVGMMVDEWVDVIPDKEETTGIAFHQNQPNAKAPQCLLLGLTPAITGHWRWDDLVDMLHETFDMARSRAVTYEQISQTPVGQLFPGMNVPVSLAGASIGLNGASVLPDTYP